MWVPVCPVFPNIGSTVLTMLNVMSVIFNKLFSLFRQNSGIFEKFSNLVRSGSPSNADSFDKFFLGSSMFRWDIL